MKNNQKSYAKYEVNQTLHGNMKGNNKLRFSLPSKLIWIIGNGNSSHISNSKHLFTEINCPGKTCVTQYFMQ